MKKKADARNVKLFGSSIIYKNKYLKIYSF